MRRVCGEDQDGTIRTPCSYTWQRYLASHLPRAVIVVTASTVDAQRIKLAVRRGVIDL